MAVDTSCPYCKKLTHMQYVDDSARYVRDGFRVEAAFQCAACDRLVIGGRANVGEGGMFLTGHETSDHLATFVIGNVAYWEPVAATGQTYSDIPPDVASAADEAHRCASIGANRAAVLMARSVIEASAKRHGITTGNLQSKIDKLAQEKLIRAVIADSAHEVRHVGNDMAHGDFATSDVRAEDAVDVLELMDDVLNDLFAVPTRIQRRRDRRANQNQTPPHSE